MEPYISKSALVEEINRRITAYQKNSDKADNKIARISIDGRIAGLRALLSFLDTLEVKEVNLNKEIESYFKGFGKFPSVGIDDCIDIAKHFFELGLIKAQKGEKV